MKLTRVVELPGKIIIYCDQRNWVLEWEGKNNRCYYPTLDDLCDEFFEIRLKMAAIKARHLKNGIKTLGQAIQEARLAARRDIELLKEARINKDGGCRTKDSRTEIHGQREC